jgi:rhamnulokinase
MTPTTNFVAVDLGASSGRVVIGRWDGSQFAVEELHRFPNAGVRAHGSIYWDVLRLWSEVKAGLSKYAAQHNASPVGISVDTWGVDFALLDNSGRLLGNPHCYRDPRTDGMPDRLFARIPQSDVYRYTGIQSMQINTLFQLFSMAVSKDPRLDAAAGFLMMPDLFHFWLSGEMSNEYTIGSTTQMLDCRQRIWARDLIKDVGIPSRFLGPIVRPGSVLSNVRREILRESGLSASFPVLVGASHDTASAVAAVPFLDENSAFISSGTWSLMGVEKKEPVTTDRAVTLNFTNEGGVGGTIRLLKNIAGLWLLQECLRQWQQEGREHSWEGIVTLASGARPLRSIVDPDATEFLAPESMPQAIRAYCARTGQPLPETEGEFARCCLESLALKYRSVLSDLECLTGRTLNTIRVVGGGSRNQLLCQFTADACQRTVVAGPVEASALGNVMMQAVATGHIDSIATGRERIAASTEIVSYEPQAPKQWIEAYQRFAKLQEEQAFKAAQSS